MKQMDFELQPTGEITRSLGWYQPYASLMLKGKVESRWVMKGKKPPFPLGPYLIYATKKEYSTLAFETIAGAFAEDAYDALGFDGDKPDKLEPTVGLNGFAIAFGRLRKVAPLLPEHMRMAFVDVCDVDFNQVTGFFECLRENDRGEEITYQLWGLWFKDVERIEPFEFKGKQGVGILTDAQFNQIEIKKGR